MRNYQLLLLLMLCLISTSCKKELPLYSLYDITGKWERISGEKPEYDGMLIEIAIDYGRILDIPSGYDYYFSINDIKWKSISPVAFTNKTNAHFLCYELASSGDYTPARITMTDDNTLIIQEDYILDGQTQIWQRVY